MALVRALGRFWIVIVALSFGGAIAFVNSEPVVVTMPTYGDYSIPLGMSFILAFAFGATTVIFYFWLDVFKKTLTIRRLRKEIRALESAKPQYTEQRMIHSQPLTAES